MTYREALMEASSLLEDSGSPWLDATLLLSHTTGERREKILASFPDELSAESYRKFTDLIQQRREGHPVAYLTGTKEFFGRDFHVKQGILCPRPDTEILVEDALERIDRAGYRRVHDLCTGSGCIALTLALEKPEISVSASDISPDSRDIFIQNRKELCSNGTSVPFTKTSLLDGLDGPFDLIVSNPPYLTTDETDERMNEGWKEPALALDGGKDGLDLIRLIIPEAFGKLNPGGCLMIEAAPVQMREIKELMIDAGFTRIGILQDIEDRDRVITGIKENE